MEGKETEIDKNMMERIVDPMIHLMRNAIDHGIEKPDEREKVGKDAEGNIYVRAYHRGGAIIIEIRDDGKGINPEIILSKAIEKNIVSEDNTLTESEVFDLIFAAGFSTAAEITDISGRGVGMDVVKHNIKDIGGSIEISSKVGEGTCFSIRLPLTLSIIDGQLFRIDDQVYIIPISSIVELIQIQPEKIKRIAGKSNKVHELRDHYIPIVNLNDVMSSNQHNFSGSDVDENSLLIVSEIKQKKIGLLVHELLSQQQVVMKSLEENYKRIEGIPAATILGDGKVALIVEIEGLYELSNKLGANEPFDSTSLLTAEGS